MPHPPRHRTRVRRIGRTLLFALLLLTPTSCSGPEAAPATRTPADGPEEDRADAPLAPFGEARSLGPFPAALPYRYDRMVASDAHVFVGVPTDPTRDAHAGSVIVHGRGADGSWGATDVLEPPDEGVEAFGEHLAVDGDVLAITANRRDPASGAQEAVVYLHERDPDGDWRPTRVLLEGEGVRPGSLTLALRNDLLALGHRPAFVGNDVEGSGFAGGPSVRLFERDAGGPGAWGEVAPVPAPARDDGRDSFFGADVDLAPDGTLLAVADTAQESDSGFGTRVHLFERPEADGDWTLVRTFGGEELPSPYSAMLEVDEDTLVVAPMAARETTRVDVAIFERDAGGADAWGRVATVSVDVATPPDRFLPRDVLLATGLADDLLVVGIGPSGCMDLRPDAGSGPSPCKGGRVHVLGPDGAGGWATRHVIEDPTGAERSSYGEYVALGPCGGTLASGGVVVREDGTAYTHADLWLREP